MKYYSTNRNSPPVSLEEAVRKSLAPDKGLYMPERIPHLPESFFNNLENLSFHEIAATVAEAFFFFFFPAADLKRIVCDTLNFDTPLVEIEDNIFSLELFHGPTLAFKDVGGRFMARMLSWFIAADRSRKGKVTILVATSGDTGSAVANGFLGVDGIDVIVLYPKGKVSEIQEKQFATLGKNITAMEVDGTFDDCQRLVKTAFLDKELNDMFTLTSANSINVARFLPQSFYYFNAVAQLITAGIIAAKTGLPVKGFIAANNRNDVFLEYLKTGNYSPRASVQTLANAMDVGDPSNFARILDLYGHDADAIRTEISGCRYTDEDIRHTIKDVYERTGYILDPHGACGYRGLKDNPGQGGYGIFLETAHPAKFKETVESILGKTIEVPERLEEFMKRDGKSMGISKDFLDFKAYMKSRIS